MLETAITLWGANTTWLELAAVTLSLACVVCNVYEIHWGWPLAIVSGLLYFWLFYVNKLYGDAWLQIFFAVVAAWGWWQWLFGKRRVDEGKAALAVAALQADTVWMVIAGWAASWLLLGLFLSRATDTDVPWFDAFPTAGSVIGQVLLARKYIENWPVWVLVNIVSVALFAYKGLWLTALLFVIFGVLAIVGYVRWKKVLLSGAVQA
jgi:nicotinamide mononucleotide transporter